MVSRRRAFPLFSHLMVDRGLGGGNEKRRKHYHKKGRPQKMPSTTKRKMPSTTKRKGNRGFTLIELLIVVAIIAILAAIAVPNFLEAQTRARVSRVVADLRALTTAIEAYRVDNNAYPREWNPSLFGDPPVDGMTNIAAIPGPVLSTPVAYVTSALQVDPFVPKGERQFLTSRYYFYYDTSYRDTPFWRAAQQFYGSWRMGSVGPDGDFRNSGTSLSPQIVYDPTNGTISPGNIWRSQKNDQIQPDPATGLISPH